MYRLAVLHSFVCRMVFVMGLDGFTTWRVWWVYVFMWIFYIFARLVIGFRLTIVIVCIGVRQGCAGLMSRDALWMRRST